MFRIRAAMALVWFGWEVVLFAIGQLAGLFVWLYELLKTGVVA